MRENCVTKQESRDIARGVAWVIVFHIGKREDPGDEVNASAFTVLMSLWKHSDCSHAPLHVTIYDIYVSMLV